MRKTDREFDRILMRLRTVIRQQGFTQLEVQEQLGWGRSYISQLFTRQKALRVEQVLMILKVINVDAGKFWAEVYPFDERNVARKAVPGRAELQYVTRLYDALVGVLKKRKLINTEDLAAAIERARTQQVR